MEFLDFAYIATVRKTSINNLNSKLEKKREQNGMQCSVHLRKISQNESQSWREKYKRKEILKLG